MDERPLHIQKGQIIWIPIYCIHRDPLFYPEPEKFDPERFNDNNKHQIKSSTYLPFGAGPRNCIGSRFGLTECKIFFYHILSNFELVPIKKTQIPLKPAKNSFIMKPEKDVWIGWKPLGK